MPAPQQNQPGPERVPQPGPREHLPAFKHSPQLSGEPASGRGRGDQVTAGGVQMGLGSAAREPQGSGAQGAPCWCPAALRWGDHCLPKSPLPPEPQSMTLFGKRVFGGMTD